MDKIESFRINHLTLKSGLYVSRKDYNGNTLATTFDIRLITPYIDEFPSMPALHTIEHLGATFLRNSERKNDIIYFGPMGCQTGFYLVVFGDLNSKDIYPLIIKMCEFILDFNGDIPGATKIECGNYLSHDLTGAKAVIEKYKTELEKYKRLEYN